MHTYLIILFDISSQISYSQQQNISFPDTIAVCLDEDKSIVSEDINMSLEKSFCLFICR